MRAWTHRHYEKLCVCVSAWLCLVYTLTIRYIFKLCVVRCHNTQERLGQSKIFPFSYYSAPKWRNENQPTKLFGERLKLRLEARRQEYEREFKVDVSFFGWWSIGRLGVWGPGGLGGEIKGSSQKFIILPDLYFLSGGAGGLNLWLSGRDWSWLTYGKKKTFRR